MASHTNVAYMAICNSQRIVIQWFCITECSNILCAKNQLCYFRGKHRRLFYEIRWSGLRPKTVVQSNSAHIDHNAHGLTVALRHWLHFDILFANVKTVPCHIHILLQDGLSLNKHIPTNIVSNEQKSLIKYWCLHKHYMASHKLRSDVFTRRCT